MTGERAAAVTLRPKKSSAIFLLLTCTAFVVLGVWMGASGQGPGYLCAAFFGLGMPLGVIQLLPGSGSLVIDAEGITFTHLFRKASLPWSAFDQFLVFTLRHSGLKVHEMVGFNYAPTYDRSKLGRAIARAVGTCEGALPDTYGKKAAERAALLNARLDAARRAGG